MRILWTKSAEENLKHIEEYIAQDNSETAINVVVNIVKSVEMLSNYPEIGRMGRLVGTRELVIVGMPFIVPYRVKKDHIEVLRILHSAMRCPDFI